MLVLFGHKVVVFVAARTQNILILRFSLTKERHNTKMVRGRSRSLGEVPGSGSLGEVPTLTESGSMVPCTVNNSIRDRIGFREDIADGDHFEVIDETQDEQGCDNFSSDEDVIVSECSEGSNTTLSCSTDIAKDEVRETTPFCSTAAKSFRKPSF